MPLDAESMARDLQTGEESNSKVNKQVIKAERPELEIIRFEETSVEYPSFGGRKPKTLVCETKLQIKS